MKKFINYFFSFFGLCLKRIPKNEISGFYRTASSSKWNTDLNDGAIGGIFLVPNLSGGYHGLLKQWWEYYGDIKGDWLLISENTKVKEKFIETYKPKSVFTLDKYVDMNEGSDYYYDLCNPNLPSIINKKFDIILCQATLEHVYSPFTALKNVADLLNPSGIALFHTHIPGFHYHPFPKDNLRFYPDWFFEMENLLGDVNLLELYVAGHPHYHIFSVYKKT